MCQIIDCAAWHSGRSRVDTGTGTGWRQRPGTPEGVYSPVVNMRGVPHPHDEEYSIPRPPPPPGPSLLLPLPPLLSFSTLFLPFRPTRGQASGIQTGTGTSTGTFVRHEGIAITVAAHP